MNCPLKQLNYCIVYSNQTTMHKTSHFHCYIIQLLICYYFFINLFTIFICYNLYTFFSSSYLNSYNSYIMSSFLYHECRNYTSYYSYYTSVIGHLYTITHYCTFINITFTFTSVQMWYQKYQIVAAITKSKTSTKHITYHITEQAFRCFKNTMNVFSYKLFSYNKQ